ncbi:MAG: cobalt ECF transporter T component CbiQ [Chloroflexota bacterium]
MHLIDNYAYGNRLRRVDPAFKASLSGMILILCLTLNSPLVGIVSVLWMATLAVWLASIPSKVFGQALLAEFGFFLFATAGVAISVTLVSPLSVNPWALRIGPLWLSTGPSALQDAFLIISRVMGCVAAMNFLALTTPAVDLIALAQRLHIPDTLVDLMTVIYRYIFVLFETMERMRKSQDSRMGYVNFKRGTTSVALLATRLFIETYQRSRQLQIALEARGYESGDLRTLPESYRPDQRLLWLGLAATMSLFLVWMAG